MYFEFYFQSVCVCVGMRVHVELQVTSWMSVFSPSTVGVTRLVAGSLSLLSLILLRAELSYRSYRLDHPLKDGIVGR